MADYCDEPRLPESPHLRPPRTQPAVWIASAEIERLTFDHTSYIASNATRRLRQLHEEKPERVEREYRKGKHGETLAYYRYVPSQYEVLNSRMQAA